MSVVRLSLQVLFSILFSFFILLSIYIFFSSCFYLILFYLILDSYSSPFLFPSWVGELGECFVKEMHGRDKRKIDGGNRTRHDRYAPASWRLPFRFPPISFRFISSRSSSSSLSLPLFFQFFFLFPSSDSPFERVFFRFVLFILVQLTRLKMAD